MTVSPDSLKELTRLANALLAADAAVTTADIALKDAKEAARKLRENEIPDYMQELGLTKITLETGEVIGYKDDVRLEWDDEKKTRAFAWLEENDFGGLIKTTVTTSFGKGDLEKAKLLLEALAKQFGYEAELKRDVHYQTMCAFLREQIAEGNAIPLDEWGAVAIKKATVKGAPLKKIGSGG